MRSLQNCEKEFHHELTLELIQNKFPRVWKYNQDPSIEYKFAYTTQSEEYLTKQFIETNQNIRKTFKNHKGARYMPTGEPNPVSKALAGLSFREEKEKKEKK